MTPDELREVGHKTALIHTGAALVIPFLALRMVLPWSEIRAGLGYILTVIAATMAAFLGVAWWSVEFPAIIGGICGLAVATGLAYRGIGLGPTPERSTGPAPAVRMRELVKATFPLWGTVGLLLLTRLEPLGWKSWLTDDTPVWQPAAGSWGELQVSASLVVQWRHIFGTEQNWSHALLYVPSVLPFVLVSSLTFLLYHTPRAAVGLAWRHSLAQVLKPVGAFLGALVLVKLLMAGGEHSGAAVLGHGVAQTAGGAWSFAAVFLGALGSFFSGSNTVSNLTFGGIQNSTATTLGLSRTTILSLQSAGGAMGNMVCIHNIVAVCSILGLANEEGRILRLTIRPLLLYGAVAGGVAFLFP